METILTYNDLGVWKFSNELYESFKQFWEEIDRLFISVVRFDMMISRSVKINW